MRKSLLAVSLCSCLCLAGSALAQDATVVDPKHYKVEFENEQIRVVRVTYKAGEKSVMHEHLPNLAVFLDDGKVKFTLPDGTSQDAVVKAGTTQWDPGGQHLPQNTGDKSFEVVLVEVKPAAK